MKSSTTCSVASGQALASSHAVFDTSGKRQQQGAKNVRSVIALSHEHHGRATLSVGAKPQLSHRS